MSRADGPISTRAVSFTLKVMKLSRGSGPVPFRVHAVRDDTGRALCCAASFRGWSDTTAASVTCPACLRALLKARRVRLRAVPR